MKGELSIGTQKETPFAATAGTEHDVAGSMLRGSVTIDSSPFTEGRCARWTTNTKVARYPRRNDPRFGF